MGELLERTCREENLLAAWQETLGRRSTEPAPAGEFEAFGEHVLDNIVAIGERLADASWRPGPVRTVEIPKAQGSGKRWLDIPSVADRVAERAVLQVITPVVDPTLQPDSYAFRPGLGVLDAVGAVQARVDEGADHVVRTDYVSCFERVPQVACLKAVAALVPDQELVRILGQCIRRSGTRGVVQGSPLSPLMVNVFLDGLDRASLAGRGQPDPLLRRRCGACGRGTRGEPRTRDVAPVRAVVGDGAVAHQDRGVRGARGRGLPRPDDRPESADPDRDRQGAAADHGLRDGARVGRPGPRREVRHQHARRQHAARTQRIVCSDRALLTTGALALAAREGVDIAVTDARNTFLGEFTHDPERGRLRVAQSQLEKARRMAIAREMIAGKLANQRVLLQRTAARRAVVPDEIAKALVAAKRRCQRAGNPDELMGIEGAAARRYFRALGLIVGDGWGFGGRNRQPPRDPVNAMLSYGYTLLLGECRTAVRLAGLDPDVGVLHRQWRGRPGVALDLMEEFRPLITDTVVLRLIGTNQVTSAEFTNDDAAGCRISQRARRALIEEFERRMLTVVGYPAQGRRVTYREILVLQAEHLARVIGGQVADYRSMPWR